MDYYDVAVIGGGASGIMAALAAAGDAGDRSFRVALFEKNEESGRKLLATGNGRCNLTNMNCCAGDYGRAADFSTPGLSAFGPVETRALFLSFGLLSREEEGGRVYPYSGQATSVAAVLRRALSERGVRCLSGSAVVRVERATDFASGENRGVAKSKGEKSATVCEAAFKRETETANDSEVAFYIETADSRRYGCRSLILATGGKAGSVYGSTGDGYGFAKSMGHSLRSPGPGLVQMEVPKGVLAGLGGVRARGRVRLYQNGRELAMAEGEVQFSEKALSGICIFDLSRFFPQRETGVEVGIDLFPQWSKAELLTYLLSRRKDLRARPKGEFLGGMMNEKLATVRMDTLCDRSGRGGRTGRAETLSDEELQLLADGLKDWRIPVSGTKGWKEAQITCGGVRLEEVEPDTMASRLVSGLYLAGELLDVDGPCGGWNLQWAWTSGRLAGLAAAEHAMK